MHSRRARMRAAEIAVRVAMLGIMALLAACAAPALALDGADMFGGKRRIDPFDRPSEQRPQAWTLLGGRGVGQYQNQPDRDSDRGGDISLKRSSPSIGELARSFG